MLDLEPRPRSPLAGLDLGRQTQAFGEARVHAIHRPFLAKVMVRGQEDDAAFLSAFGGMLGIDLPTAPPGLSMSENYRALRLGPDAWLVLAAPGSGPELRDKLELAFLGLSATAIDVSSAYTTVRLTGPEAATLISAGCEVDLHPRAFPAGSAVRTRVGNADVLLERLDAGDGTSFWELHVPRSLAISFWRWLEHAGREFRIVVTSA